jgi:ABC-type multidrug transport system fused ATPase/permease subunit
MLFYSPLLTLAAFVPVPFLIVGALVYTFAGKKIYEREREAASSLGTILHDNLDGIRQIKTYTSETREQLRFEEACNEVRHSMLAVMKAWAFYSPTMNFLGSLGMICILTVGVQSVLYHHMELGVLVAFLVLARYLYEPIDRLHSLHELLQAGRAAGNRLFSIIDEAPEPGYATAEKKRTAPQKCSLEGLQGEVEFRHVNFSYSQETPLLHDIALHAYPGQMIALVGPTGSGKSTLVNLLSRFYELTSGEIFFDGHSLRDLPLKLLRHSIGMVTQESFLFNGSTADNLRIGRPEVTEEEMWNALKAANAAAFVERLPKGLYTALGERGIKLSVGEKQRISIARALLKNPPILVLDEATASVDNTTERLIQEALQRLLAGRTSFVIAHRLSTILQADQILVLDRGHIIERGTHETLLARQGLYAQLYQASLAK